jgi:uncharacterized membrane protein
MPIVWNKVTWYSKLVAIIIFVLTFYVGFVLGIEKQRINDEKKVGNLQIDEVSKEDVSNLPLNLTY